MTSAFPVPLASGALGHKCLQAQLLLVLPCLAREPLPQRAAFDPAAPCWEETLVRPLWTASPMWRSSEWVDAANET